MKALAKSILNLAAFIKLTPIDKINPATARRAIEQLVADLSEATQGELEYLKSAVRQEIVEIGDKRTAAQQDRIEFLLGLMENVTSAKHE
jgi:hypothetical protein